MSNKFAYIDGVGSDDNNSLLKSIYPLVLNKTIKGIDHRRHKVCNSFCMYSDKHPDKSFTSGMNFFAGCWSQIETSSRNDHSSKPGMRKRAKIKLYVVRLKAGMN